VPKSGFVPIGPSEGHVPVATTLAVLNVNQHATAVDVADPELAELGVPHARRIQDHEHRPIGEILRSIDQTGDFLRGENHRYRECSGRLAHMSGAEGATFVHQRSG
jgi:hypothetical protein